MPVPTDLKDEDQVMKISALSSGAGYPVTIREKREGSFHKHPGYEQPNQEKSHEQSEEKPDQKQIDDAIEAFQLDPQTQENGLNASSTGNGPGLKVVLKDGQGGIVRQFTGEEFLRLRQSLSKDKRICGKILDQKL